MIGKHITVNSKNEVETTPFTFTNLPELLEFKANSWNRRDRPLNFESLTISATENMVQLTLLTRADHRIVNRFTEKGFEGELKDTIQEFCRLIPNCAVTKVTSDLHRGVPLVTFLKELGLTEVPVVRIAGVFSVGRVNYFCKNIFTPILEIDARDPNFPWGTIVANPRTRIKFVNLNMVTGYELNYFLDYHDVALDSPKFTSMQINGLLDYWYLGNVRQLRNFKITCNREEFNLEDVFNEMPVNYILLKEEPEKPRWTLSNPHGGLASIVLNSRNFEIRMITFPPKPERTIIDATDEIL